MRILRSLFIASAMFCISLSAKSSDNQAKMGNSVVIGRGCNNRIVIASGIGVGAVKQNQNKAPCVDLNATSNPFEYSKDDLVSHLTQMFIETRATVKGIYNSYDVLDQELINDFEIIHSTLQKKESGNFVFGFIDPKDIKFNFQLSRIAYYDSKAAANPRKSSENYGKELKTLEIDVKKLKGLLMRIHEFNTKIEAQIKDSIVRLEGEKTLAGQRSRQQKAESSVSRGETGYGTSLKNKAGPGETDFSHSQSADVFSKGQTSGHGQMETTEERTVGRDVQVKSLSREIVESLIQDYEHQFSAQLTPDQPRTLATIEAQINDLSLKTEKELYEKELRLKRFSDPILKVYWAKLETLLSQEAEGLEPKLIFYRNFNSYQLPKFVKGMADPLLKSRANPKARIRDEFERTKEFSGFLAQKKRTSEHEPDEVYIAFSGSNSSEDWKHNLDIIKVQGDSKTQLAGGYKVHGGILQSLSASLEDSGTSVYYWLQDYLKTVNPKSKRTLRIHITGHSLGGALALLMATFVHENIKEFLKNKVTVEILVYTYAAPPIFREESAQQFEEAIGKANIFRVWTLGDPVANISLFKRNRKDISLLMRLVDFRHVGLSIPLYDNRNLASIVDELNPWKNHLSDRYYNLIRTNWEDLLNHEANYLQGDLNEKGYFKKALYEKVLGKMIEFIDTPNKKPYDTFNLQDVKYDEFTRDITNEEHPQAAGNIPSLMKSYDDKLKEARRRGEASSPRLSRATRDNIEYIYNFKNKSLSDKVVKVDQRTTCDANAILKSLKMKEENIYPNERIELSCTCCLTKNFLLAENTLTEKAKKVFRLKDVSDYKQTMQHCLKHCDPLIRDGTLSYGDPKSVREFLNRKTSPSRKGPNIAEAFDEIKLKIK